MRNREARRRGASVSGYRWRAALLTLGALFSSHLLAADDTPKPQVDYPGWHDAPLPEGPVGAAIARGHLLLTNAPKYAAAYSGNALTCTNCHLDGGRTPAAAPWVGIWGVFPEYRPRNARVNTLADRINDCFERSLNGKRLPNEAPEMTDMLAYMQWVSREVPTGQSVPGRGFQRLAAPQAASAERGAPLYAQHCASCHSADGAGRGSIGDAAHVPPLWGAGSFNIGAGMARLNNAAAFIKANMPQGNAGSLDAQTAFDIAAYVINQPRPDFARKGEDWPKGGKPPDARY
jgi:thiosulfate dehydrogenase